MGFEHTLLATIDPADRLRPTWMNFCTGGPVNELGLAWDPVQDCFRFVPPPDCNEPRLTKRTALAELARIFDPAGWIAPVTVVAKLAIQDLWRVKLDWDEPTPEPWAQEWLKFRASMKQIKSVSLPRWIGWEKTSSIQLHAFADASRRAMAAAVYFRNSNESVVSTSLLSAKTNLAPLKNLAPTTRPAARMTIPRMELRAALLAAKLIQFTSEHLKIPLTQCHLWSNSQVVLHWLRSDGPTGHEFVDNYVQHIQETVPEATWHYVPTTDNPADVASRGTTVQHLGSFSLWWSGPAWLKNSPGDWPAQHIISREACQEEENTWNVACFTASLNPADTYPVERFSNLNRLLRTMTHCRRLCLRRTDTQASAVLSPITATDTRREWLACVRLSQQQDFEADINRLRQSLPIQRGNPLRALSPFLDDDQVLRVGGRLTHSQLPYDEKHPVILSGRSHLGRLLIDWAHLRALHAGFRVTYAYAIQRAWLIGGRVAVKAHLCNCTVCAKTLMKPQNPIMAPLPEARVSPCRPFSRCGVDYAGPFQLLRSSGRRVSSTKGCIALFVCLSSKAIHLELVGDLTTQSFMGALTRFVGRRGRPREMWSDNGTNFRGANQELNRLLHAAQLSWGTVEERLAQDGISWHYIPPGAPHFGGIWEAGVKSAKTHLRRVVDSRKLTYEELSTLLVEVETILNCRPLAPLSGDMDDIEALTPAHLLIGTSLTSVPRPTTDHVNLDHSTHWNLVRGMRDHFWSRWSKEYLNTLQQRVKWTRPSANLMPGDLVMVFDLSLLRPNGRWPVGRIIETHAGRDNVVRVATVKTVSGIYTRPVVKLARLPIHEAVPADAAPC